MEARAKIPVLRPVAEPTAAYWQEPPDELADWQSEIEVGEMVEEADVVVVGSGITGAATAFRLLAEKKELRVVMLEARGLCSGATGRNGGHTKAASYRIFPTSAQQYGTEAAAKIARFEYESIKGLHKFARDEGIECDLWSGDTVDVFMDQSIMDEARKAVVILQESMTEEGDAEGVAKYTFYDREEAREKLLVKGEGVVGAVRYFAGSLSAYRFVCGVLRKAISLGLELYTHTPVTSLTKSGDGWLIHTDKGVIKAKRVVLATNGYTAAIWPPFQGSIVPLRGQITAQRPGLSLPQTGLPTTYSFIYPIGAGSGYEYMISRPAASKFEFPGDVIIGGGLTKNSFLGVNEYGTVDDASMNSEISEYLTGVTEKYFGESWGEDHEEGRVRKEWTGIMGYTGDGMPFVGEVPGQEGLWVAAAFQGHGMVFCWGCAEGLVDMMQGKEDLGFFPEQFRVTGERMKMSFDGRH